MGEEGVEGNFTQTLEHLILQCKYNFDCSS